MTISAQYIPDVTQGDGFTTVFPFTWRILAKTDLRVYKKVTATGVITPMVLNTDFTVPDGDVDTISGGNITMTVAPTTLETLTRARSTALTQLNNFEVLNAALIAKAMDRITMIEQEQAYLFTETMRLAPGSGFAMQALPHGISGGLLRWLSTINGFENVTITELAAATMIIPVAIAATDTTAVIVHNLNNANAQLVSMPSTTWQTSVALISQDANTMTVEFATECPAGGGTMIAMVNG